MLSRLAIKRRAYFDDKPYKMIYFEDYDYNDLHFIMYHKKTGRGGNQSYNDCIIMFDTETSKKVNTKSNIVVAWTISIRAFERNIVTLWGRKPSDLIKCISNIHNNMRGEETYIYCHNLAYDWVFCRKFMIKEWDAPKRQLSTKSHNPILFKFENGIILKDSLILAQRSLEKWAKDLNVEHTKAVGKWEYNKIRSQYEDFSADELEYIEHDTLAGVECIDALRITLNKQIYSMPYTATGIPREESRKIGEDNRAHDRFTRFAPTYDQYNKLLNIFHGGYTHGNRHLIDEVLHDVECYDFASSYPYVMLSEKYPSEKFSPLSDKPINFILKHSEKYAFMFKLILIKPRLKDYFIPMPSLQHSKCVSCINPILDNGRILCAEYVEIYLNEIDLAVINEHYDYDKHICTEVEFSLKRYLPRWFTDYIYKLFKDKTQLKGADKVLYALAKAKLNSLYGMTVQKCVRENLKEDFTTGEYYEEEQDPEKEYEKYLNRRGSIFPYFWGCWVTSYAFRNLFELGKCINGKWVYSDTDSCYATKWDVFKIACYNAECETKLANNGYYPIEYNGRTYCLGKAEFDGAYSEYKVLGAKRYCGRSKEDNELHITVAGVPKRGAACLNNDINNFSKGFIFPGTKTGKLTHTYIYVDDITIDPEGNEVADSINLEPCDYLLDDVLQSWEFLENKEVLQQVYDESEE